MRIAQLVIDGPKSVVMVASGAVRHQCPFVDEKDEGIAEIVWDTGRFGKTMELHALANYLSGFEKETLSHEALTEQIYSDLRHQGIVVVRVVTRWQTAGMDITCTTSPTPVTAG